MKKARLADSSQDLVRENEDYSKKLTTKDVAYSEGSPPPNENTEAVTNSEGEEESADHVLEVLIQHTNNVHTDQKPGDVTTYRVKNSDGKYADLDLEDASFSNLEIEDEELKCNFEDKVVIVKRSAVDKYRLNNNYYGPLKVLVQTSEILQDGQRKQVNQIKFQHIIFKVRDNDGKEVSQSHLEKIMKKTPGIIPPCNPPECLDDEGHFFISFGVGETFAILRRAISAFKQLSGHNGLLNTRIKKVFKPVKGKLTAMSILKIFPRISTSSPLFTEIETLNEKTDPAPKGKSDSTGASSVQNTHTLLNCYSQNYINWRHRGSISLCQLKKTGVDFIKEVLSGTNETPDSLAELGCSYTSLTEDENIEAQKMEHDESSRCLDNPEELWSVASQLANSRETLIVLEFEFNDEKWLEVKRTCNSFQVNDEVHPDIILKLMMSNQPGRNPDLNFYIRCVGRLIKSGKIKTKLELHQILNCLASDRYVCIGNDKDLFMGQLDQNEMLRHCVKENSFMMMNPFEALYSKKCKGIVRNPPSDHHVGNIKFSRGSVRICGTYFHCKPCAALKEKLSRLIDHELEDSKYIADSEGTRFVRHRHGPVKFVKINKNLRNLFTQTPVEFVNNSRARNTEARILYSSSLPLKRKSPEFDDDLPDELLLPEIKVSEEKFAKLITFKHSSNNDSGNYKICNACRYKTKSMLSLFAHMRGHLGPLTHLCGHCKLRLSSEEALQDHSKLCLSPILKMCKKCFKNFVSQEKLDDHMNTHRDHQPFICHVCAERQPTLNAFKKHVKIQHDICTAKELNFTCKTCSAYFYYKDFLFIHRVNYNHDTNIDFVCKHCHYASKTVSQFFKHISSHSMKLCERFNTVPCIKCQKLFFSLFKYQQHLMLVHNEIKSNESDPSNPMEFNRYAPQSENNVLLYTSNGIEIGTEPDIIKNKTDDAAAYQPINQWPKIACQHCKRPFDSQHKYESHIKLHSSSNAVFQCEECGFVYSRRQQVVEHIRKDHYYLIERQTQAAQHEQLKEPNSAQQEVDDLEFLSDVDRQQTSTTAGLSPFKLSNIDSQQSEVYEILNMPEFP